MRISDWSSDVCSSDLGDAALTRAARQRLALLGIPSSTIAAVERGGRPNNVITVSAPTGGVIKTLGVRAGMTVAAGQTLAEINGLGTVWLNAAVPEAVAGQLKSGQPVQATRSEAHTSELQSLMRSSYAVFSLKKKKKTK